MSGPRILVVGANGMLGHEAIRVLAPDFEVWGACRHPEQLPDLGVPAERILGGLDATERQSAYDVLERVRPDLVINGVGLVKQRPEGQSPIPAILLNSLWPHVLAQACAEHGARMVHVSTDCVFSGSRGMYTEDDLPDAQDVYGRTKLLGEVVDRDNVVTIRTSIIGWQLTENTGLVGWFAAHRHEPLRGYARSVYSGLTTRALTEVIRDVVMPDARLSGLWQVSPEPIDKYTLLSKLAGYLGWDVDLTPMSEPVSNHSLDSTRFRERTGWEPPSWDAMLEGLAQEHVG